MGKILQVKNLSYSVEKIIIPLLKKERVTILSDISFDIEENEIVGIAGESGSGKTTLAKIICGLLTKDSGEIISGIDTLSNKRTNPIQILFQNNGEILNPLRKVGNLISEALYLYNNSDKNIEKEIEKLLEAINLPNGILDRYCFELSGGQQQRVALARILAVKPKLLICDEPFSSQDIESQVNIVELLRTLSNKFGITIICISHSLFALKNLCNRIMILYKGKLVEQNTVQEIFTNPKDKYTKYLLDASSFSSSN